MKLVYVLLFLCLISCKDSSNIGQEDKEQKFSKELVTKLDVESLKYVEILVDSKVKKQINSWGKYQELNSLISDVKEANLSFFTGNTEVVNTLCEELQSTIPESMKTPQVSSRMIALETKILKLESLVNQSNVKKEKLIGVIKELLVAFSNLNLQMNKKVEKESQNIQKPS